MSPVRLNGSTSGYSELSAPAVAGNNSIALPTSNGSAYQMLRNGATAGSLEFTDNIVSGTAVASTSGTNIDFTSIPSWVKRITVNLGDVSLSGSTHLLVQLGTSSGVESSSYNSSSNYVLGGSTSGSTSSTAGIVVFAGGTANTVTGSLVFGKLSGNRWIATGLFNFSNLIGYGVFTAGDKSLSGTLDRVRITNSGADTFDAGSINLLWE
jgi:hypothetical protein